MMSKMNYNYPYHIVAVRLDASIMYIVLIEVMTNTSINFIHKHECLKFACCIGNVLLPIRIGIRFPILIRILP
jgi:hypothetical protein